MYEADFILEKDTDEEDEEGLGETGDVEGENPDEGLEGESAPDKEEEEENYA